MRGERHRRNRRPDAGVDLPPDDETFPALPIPQPTLRYRRRAWLAFQRALDPLGPPKPMPRRQSEGA